MNIMQIINLVVKVVALIELIFDGKKRQGTRKRNKALRTLTKLVAPKAKMDKETATMLGALVDLVAKGASNRLGDTPGYQDLLNTYNLIAEAVSIMDGFIEDPEELKEEVAEMVDGAVDLPLLDDNVEAMVIALMVDFAVSEIHKGIADA